MTRELVRNRWLYFMLLPGILFFIVFKYVPIWGMMIAFQQYHPFKGVWGSEWAGLAHFTRLFNEPSFWLILRNTVILAVYNIVFFFPFPIALAILLNEIRFTGIKRWMQSILYIPHFISWVVVVGICYMLFSIQDGIVPYMMETAGFEPINFLQSSEWFRFMITGQVIWKESGWSTIIFLAAISSIDPQAYEAATIDGAGRLRKIWHVTLPALRSTIVILLIIRLGSFLDIGFEQIFLMLNSVNRQVGEVFDTYVYTTGIQQGNFSYSTAVGLFKSVVGAILVYTANKLSRRYGEDGIF